MIVFVKYLEGPGWFASDENRDWNAPTFAKLCLPKKARAYHAGGTGGDREVIQICAEGHSPTFSRVQNGHVLASNVLGVRLINAKSLTGLSLTQLERLPNLTNTIDTRAALTGLHQIASVMEGLTLENPIDSGASSLGGVVARYLVERHGHWPVEFRYADTHLPGRTECYQLGELGATYRTDRHSAYAAAYLSAPEKTEVWHVTVKVPDWRASPWPAMGLVRPIYATGVIHAWVWPYFLDKYPKMRLHIKERIPVDTSWLRQASSSLAELYERRLKEQDNVVNTVCKRLLQNAYGRLVMTGRGQWAKFQSTPPKKEGMPYHRFGENRYLVFGELSYSVKPNFLLGAWITEHGRAQLWPELAVNETVRYVATDAIYSGRLPDVDYGDGCGKWSIAESRQMTLWGHGDYSYGDEVKRAGGTAVVRETIRARTPEALPRWRKSWYDGRCLITDGHTRPWTIREAERRWQA